MDSGVTRECLGKFCAHQQKECLTPAGQTTFGEIRIPEYSNQKEVSSPLVSTTTNSKNKKNGEKANGIPSFNTTTINDLYLNYCQKF